MKTKIGVCNFMVVNVELQRYRIRVVSDWFQDMRVFYKHIVKLKQVCEQKAIRVRFSLGVELLWYTLH